MSVTFLKKANKVPASGEVETRARVEALLADIEQGREARVSELARELDRWSGDIIVGPEAFDAAEKLVPQQIKDDIRFAHDNVRRFAEAQRKAMQDLYAVLTPEQQSLVTGGWGGGRRR